MYECKFTVQHSPTAEVSSCCWSKTKPWQAALPSGLNFREASGAGVPNKLYASVVWSSYTINSQTFLQRPAVVLIVRMLNVACRIQHPPQLLLGRNPNQCITQQVKSTCLQTSRMAVHNSQLFVQSLQHSRLRQVVPLGPVNLRGKIPQQQERKDFRGIPTVAPKRRPATGPSQATGR